MVKLIMCFGIILMLSRIVFAQAPLKEVSKKASYHFQLTTVLQGHPAFRALYSGKNSLVDTAEQAISLTTTLFLGRSLWKGASIYVDPEIAGGKGISGALGLGGFTNGETFRIGDPTPELYLARAFIRQHIALRRDKWEKLDDDNNQIEEWVPAYRLDITIGKLAISDLFDNNRVSHDPRMDFLNWTLMNNGAWDYPANTRGYTPMVALELLTPEWCLRIAEALEPKSANGSIMDWNISQSHSETIELERKGWLSKKLPGSIRLLGYINHNRAPQYLQVIQAKLSGTDTSMDVVTGKNYGGVKYGWGLNMDQQLSSAIVSFMRLGWNDGKTASWAFTEVDQSLSAGIKISGSLWKRSKDILGLAAVVNGISRDHRDFLNAGGYGFMLGDGKLTHYQREQIMELFYETVFRNSLFLTLDYQFIRNPGYNADRGPV
ncbi:MAG: carbohydrate porin, partial [Chitinophagaceae bacterium]